jgi:hypothetical protein
MDNSGNNNSDGNGRNHSDTLIGILKKITFYKEISFLDYGIFGRNKTKGLSAEDI